jgi:peptidylprolyl isomerase
MIQDGRTVKIHYTGTLDDGNRFDSSAGRDPLDFEILNFEMELVGTV